MRDSRRKKAMDLRRAHLGGDNPSLYRMYNRLHPEVSRRTMLWRYDREEWTRLWNEEQEWVRQQTGLEYYHCGQGNAPAHYRRTLNQLQRAREKAAMRKAEVTGNWDDFYLPPRKRNANWNWW